MPEFVPDYTQISPKSGSFKAGLGRETGGHRIHRYQEQLKKPDIFRTTVMKAYDQGDRRNVGHARGRDIELL